MCLRWHGVGSMAALMRLTGCYVFEVAWGRI